MSYRDDEKRWKRIQEMLVAEASGKTVRPLVSQRTLFGIPSTVEQTIERIVAQDEEERRVQRQRAKDEEDPCAQDSRDDGGEERRTRRQHAENEEGLSTQELRAEGNESEH